MRSSTVAALLSVESLSSRLQHVVYSPAKSLFNLIMEANFKVATAVDESLPKQRKAIFALATANFDAKV
jgi:hypothetical protein